MTQDSDSRPRKRMRRDSDSSVGQSTQTSSLDVISWQTHRVPSSSPAPVNSASSARRDETERPGQRKDNEHTIENTTIAISKHTTSTPTNTTQPSHSLPQSSTQRSACCNSRAIRHALRRKAQNHDQDQDQYHDEEQGVEFHLPASTTARSDVAVVDSQPSLRTIPERNGSDTQPDSQSQGEGRHQPTAHALNTSYEHDTEHDTEIDDNDDVVDVESIISLSPSAFDSQPNATNAQGTNDDSDDGNGNENGNDETASQYATLNTPHSSNPRTPSTSACRQKRIAAYRAARSGSFELWSSVYSPVTAGNNHSEADMEL